MMTTFSIVIDAFSLALPGVYIHLYTPLNVILILGPSPRRSTPRLGPTGWAAMALTDLREILRYVPRFRDKLFVIALDGALVESENFRNVLLDIALLRSLRIGVCLVHRASHQIRRLAESTGVSPSNLDGAGITDEATLRL